MGSNQEVYTNAEGRYSITGLNPGRYQVQFIDPSLEAVGFVPPAIPRDVIRGEMTTLDYHMPSIGDVLFEACRDEARPEDSVILAGLVRDLMGQAVVGATVTARWSEFRVVAGRLTDEDVSGFETTTNELGFYRFCGVPTDVRVDIQALLGDAESDVYSQSFGVGAGAALQAIDLRR